MHTSSHAFGGAAPRRPRQSPNSLLNVESALRIFANRLSASRPDEAAIARNKAMPAGAGYAKETKVLLRSSVTHKDDQITLKMPDATVRIAHEGGAFTLGTYTGLENRVCIHAATFKSVQDMIGGKDWNLASAIAYAALCSEQNVREGRHKERPAPDLLESVFDDLPRNLRPNAHKDAYWPNPMKEPSPILAMQERIVRKRAGQHLAAPRGITAPLTDVVLVPIPKGKRYGA